MGVRIAVEEEGRLKDRRAMPWGCRRWDGRGNQASPPPAMCTTRIEIRIDSDAECRCLGGGLLLESDGGHSAAPRDRPSCLPACVRACSLGDEQGAKRNSASLCILYYIRYIYTRGLAVPNVAAARTAARPGQNCRVRARVRPSDSPPGHPGLGAEGRGHEPSGMR